jgi:hypothetical protein
MVKKLGKRRRKELAKAKRAKRMKDKMVDDNSAEHSRYKCSEGPKKCKDGPQHSIR